MPGTPNTGASRVPHTPGNRTGAGKRNGASAPPKNVYPPHGQRPRGVPALPVPRMFQVRTAFRLFYILSLKILIFLGQSGPGAFASCQSADQANDSLYAAPQSASKIGPWNTVACAGGVSRCPGSGGGAPDSSCSSNPSASPPRGGTTQALQGWAGRRSPGLRDLSVPCEEQANSQIGAQAGSQCEVAPAESGEKATGSEIAGGAQTDPLGPGGE